MIDDKLHWYKDAIIYELHIKAFRDGNGDGIGDFNGLMQQLDYLQWLGVTTIWLLPFYPSPLRDDGYDIADYYTINPSYGNLEDFRGFLAEAHRRGLRVITELVINHTSDQHAWFQRARQAPKGSPEREFYVWTDNPEQYKDVRIIFQDYETSNWTWDPVAGQYYWHRFFHHQPDLNYDNPLVQEEIMRVLDYWCGMGVDGFRLDAVPYLFEREGTNGENLPETHEFLKKIRAHVDEKYPGTLLLAEANMWPEDSASYFGAGDECHMNYHFPVMPRMFMALQMEDRYPITDIFDQTPAIPETCQWGIFLRNHDELTLEMVTDEERDYMYKVYVKDPKARINLGIRHRLAPLMGADDAKIKLLNYLLFSLPGTPVLYYGDEIGMGDNFYLGDRDGVRTPMQWSSSRNAGFSEANPQQLYLPLILDPLYHYESVNVERQSRDTSSLLWWMKRLIQVRNKSLVFGRGDMAFIDVDNARVLAFTRSYEDDILLVVVNLSRHAQPACLDLQQYAGYQPVEVFGGNKFRGVKAEHPYFLSLGPYTCHWFMLQRAMAGPRKDAAKNGLHLEAWSERLSGAFLDRFEKVVLPGYLPQMRWFGGKARRIEGIRVENQHCLALPGAAIIFLLIEVSYSEGLPETYQLPVTIASGADADARKESCPQSVICSLSIGDEDAVLYDAYFGQALQRALIWSMAQEQASGDGQNRLRFSGSPQLKEYTKTHESITPRVLGAEQSNTSVTYDKAFFLKLYRKVDRAVNSDLEITRFLTQDRGFTKVPVYSGSVEWQLGNDRIVLGMLQEMISGGADGWEHMQSRLRVYYEALESQAQTAPDSSLTSLSLTHPSRYEDIPVAMQLLLEATTAEQVSMLGQRTAELHLVLSSVSGQPEFSPEPFSLHYQRSLFSSFQTLVRTAFQSLSRKMDRLSPGVLDEARALLPLKDEILQIFRRIYSKKLEAAKIRIHGDYHLGQVLFCGNDVVMLDFEGEPAKSYSERRLKRSPLRDVAGMIRSFHYAAYGYLLLDGERQEDELQRHIMDAERWYTCMSGIFLQSYLEHAAGAVFMPQAADDMELMLQTYLLEKAIYELNYELNNRPDWVIIPLHGIRSLVETIRGSQLAGTL
jgi:maltose alpha-D-glucosyltransferase/alpha-amylase